MFSFQKACQIALIILGVYIIIITVEITYKFNQIGIIDSEHLENINKILDYVQYDIGSSDFFLLFALFFGFFYLKLLFELKPIQMFGNLITTIEKILLKVLKFFIIYFLILIAFSALGTILFCTINLLQNEYQTFGMSVTTLIGYTFGGFSLSNYLNLSSVYYKGYIQLVIFCFLFLFLFNIFLINLLIGLISDIYSKAKDNSKENYLIEIYKETQLLSDCSRFSSLTSSYIVLINWTYFLYVGYFFINSQTINIVLLGIHYFFIFCLNFVILLIYDICLVPFVYLIGIVKFFYIYFIKQKPNKEKICSWIFFLLLGLPFLLLSALVNFIQTLFLLLYSKKEESDFDSIQIVPSKKAFKILMKELIKSSGIQFRNHLNLIPIEGIQVFNEKHNELIKRLRIENKYSKIDLIFIFSLLERLSIEENIFYPLHYVTIVKAEKAYFKLNNYKKKLSNFLPNDKWRKFIQVTKPKVHFSKIIKKDN